MKCYIGLMSGTSMDGIDAALVDVETNRLIAGIIRPYSPATHERLERLLSNESHSLREIAQLNTLLGQEFAAAVLELLESSKTKASEVIAIGSHGQTVCHDATADLPFTMQLACPHTIAEHTGITVVADFRTRDLVLKGKGAPFAPIYHQALFSQLGEHVAVVNVGGISNITLFDATGRARGFDCGPGNCLMDAWTQRHLGVAYDRNGEWAASGRVIEDLLAKLLNDPYFHLKAPKSIGKEYFSLAWLEAKLPSKSAPEDVQATLLALTADSITQTCKHLGLTHMLLCGGGAHNQALVERLSQQLPTTDVTTTEAYQINPDFLEAMMFAWLAHQTLTNTPLDLTQITGASKPAVLGAIYHR